MVEREQARALRALTWTLAEIDQLMAAGRERIGPMTDQKFLAAGVALHAGEGPRPRAP